ncbi:hypothetical protein H3H36_17610 [Duganella sp. FT3S]|uniref:Uncharacterized protein n=1 Tax=Rugamonas fusca TaxID=2758568 RepID=A0A7W2EJP6_9BURK|nr:hypothetical protein [Rugamonas fusca]MBA5607177.1 hypothetical protein [Rugamonas fusca]
MAAIGHWNDVQTINNEALECMAQASGTTKGDILCKALALLEVASEARKQGKRIAILTKDKQVVTEIVGGNLYGVAMMIDLDRSVVS